MTEATRSGLPALAPPVPAFEPSARKTTTAGADDPDVPPALPPKELRPDKGLPKPKMIFPGPPQAFAMSGPRRPAQSPPQHATTNGRSARHLPQMPEPSQSSERGAALVNGDTRTRPRDAQSRSQTLPLPVPVADLGPSQKVDSRANDSTAVAQGATSERLAVRTSSRPRAPRSSTGGPGHLSSTPTSLRMIDTAVARVPSPVLSASPTSRPSLPSTPISASPTDSLHPHSYIGSNDGHTSPNLYHQQQSRVRERSASPSPRSRESPSQYSVMDRPRPKTPEPSSSSVFAPQNGTSSRLLAPRPSAPAVLPAFAAAPIFPGPPSSASKTSVLDRPRPKTPEVFQRLDSSPSSAKTATSPRDSVSRQSDGRTTTPTPIFPSKPRTSVLDRPRPRTPRSAAPTEESVHMSESPVSAPVTNDVVRTESRNREPSSPLLSPSLDGDSASRQTVADDEKSIRDPDPVLPKPSVLDRPRPKTPDAASWLHGAGHKGPAATGHHARPNYSIATSGTAFSSSKSGSLDSIGPVSGSSSVSVTSPASTVSSFRPSVESASHPHQQQQQAAEPASPLLKLDFDFGSTFSSAETMFGLSDYLQLGGDATPKHRSVTPTAPPPLKSEDIERGSIAEDVAEPIHAPERGPSRTKEPEPSTPTRSSSTPHVPAETLARTPLATSSGDPSSPRSVLAVAGAPATDEAGSFETRRTSNASAIADEQVKTSPLFSGSDASPDRPKRKRRKSLASLLSFRSTNHSVDDTHGPPDSTDGAAHRRYTPQEEGSRETGPYSSHTTSEREFGSLPQPNRHAPEPILGPVVARQRSYNLDASPDNPRKRGPGAAFQVISATSSRQPSRNASGSVSSLHTSETDSSDLHSRPSLDFYRLSSRGKSDIYPEKTDSRHQRAPSATLPLGRRLVEKFTRGAATRPTPEGPAQSWSAPLKNHSAEDSTPRPRLGRRRGSFSSLLGFGSGGSDSKRSVSGQSEKSDAPRTLLGMSLPAGRRSEDLLTSGRRGGSEQSGQTRHFRGPESRRSFDVLTERKPRGSIGDDDLLVRQGSNPITPPCSNSFRLSADHFAEQGTAKGHRATARCQDSRSREFESTRTCRPPCCQRSRGPDLASANYLRVRWLYRPRKRRNDRRCSYSSSYFQRPADGGDAWRRPAPPVQRLGSAVHPRCCAH
mgnify:CR=1 FL=1|jgi:hypothetical protein